MYVHTINVMKYPDFQNKWSENELKKSILDKVAFDGTFDGLSPAPPTSSRHISMNTGPK